MKSLLLVRHAKSSWNFDVDDFERPLNERGNTNAPVMARRLLNKQITIDAFVSSPATRALATATHFAKIYGVPSGNITTVAELYEPLITAFNATIANFSDSHNTVALFSHNPAITEFANTLTATRIDEMPTCAVFGIHSDTDVWADFATAEKTFWFFDYPKLSD